MNIQAVNYKPIRQVSFEGKKQLPQEQNTPQKGLTLNKAVKVGFILSSAVASYGIFKGLAPKAVKAISKPLFKILPKKVAVKESFNKFTQKKFMQKSINIVKWPFAKAKEGISWAYNKSHSFLVKQMESNKKTEVVLNKLTQFRDWNKNQVKSVIDSIKKTNIKETLIETGSVVAAIGGGAEAADAVSSKNIKEVV